MNLEGFQKGLFLLLCFPAAAGGMAVFMYELIAFTPNHRCSSCLEPTYYNMTLSSSSLLENVIPSNPDNLGSYLNCQIFE